jgi:hypothetical protein
MTDYNTTDVETETDQTNGYAPSHPHVTLAMLATPFLPVAASTFDTEQSDS